MAGKAGGLGQPTNVKGARIPIWFIGAACLSIILALVVRLGMQMVIPHPPPRLQLVKDIPLPGALPDIYRTSTHPLAPGLAVLFDHFDFQALDPNTHLLFIAHTGPSPDREKQVNPRFDPGTDIKTDGNFIVFDILQQKGVGLLNIRQVPAIVVTPDLTNAYAVKANDG